ncbi:MAG: ATP-binding protein [Candidatus Bathyarchaeota archaeon]|jgi:GMP synthase (glutamine-hydrolysing)
MSKLDVDIFVKSQIEIIRETLGGEKALVAVSGGVDSTVSALLVHKAIGDNLVCVFIDDNFMRQSEPENVRAMLSSSPLNLPVNILGERDRFMRALAGLEDAEEKRKAFRETFYQTLSDASRAEGCQYLVQGTIKADIEETAGGIKTQHNILEQIGIDPVERFGFTVIEPIASLYKYQVREVARYLGAPTGVSERQPFPGPGLSVRVVGLITEEKLQLLKIATEVVEERFAEHKPAQYFAAIMSGETVEPPPELWGMVANALDVNERHVNIRYLKERGTGMFEGNRTYGNVAVFSVEEGDSGAENLGYDELERAREAIQSSQQDISRVLYGVAGRDEDGYYISMRAVETQDFLTAEISKIPLETLNKSAWEILEACPRVSKVFYDVTPKPPATVEYE